MHLRNRSLDDLRPRHRRPPTRLGLEMGNELVHLLVTGGRQGQGDLLRLVESIGRPIVDSFYRPIVPLLAVTAIRPHKPLKLL
jgi:hypothetical protein